MLKTAPVGRCFADRHRDCQPHRAVWILQSHLVPRSTYEHGEIASNMLAGRGFAIRFLGATGPTSQQVPVYPTIVAVAYAIGGVETPRALFLLEMGQAILVDYWSSACCGCRVSVARTAVDGMVRRLDRRTPSHLSLRGDARPGRHLGSDLADMDARLGVQTGNNQKTAQCRNHWRVPGSLGPHRPDSGDCRVLE